MNAQDISSPDGSSSGYNFDFTEQRTLTPKSSTSGNISDVYEISRVESYDELVARLVSLYH